MRTLGIDIQDQKVLLAQLDTHLGKPILQSLHEIDISSESVSSIGLTLSNFFTSEENKPSRIIIAIPNSYFTNRTFTFPTKDLTTLYNALLFETEDDLPLVNDNLLIDYVILKQEKQKTSLYAVTTLRSFFSHWIQEWDSHTISPNIVTTEIWAFQQLLLKLQPSSLPSLILHLGKNDCTCYLFSSLHPILTEKILLPSEKIHSEFQQTLDPTQNTSHSKVIHQMLQPLIQKITLLNLICKTTSGQTILQIYLTGTYCPPQYFDTFIEQITNIPTRILKATDVIQTQNEISPEQEAKFIKAISLATCSYSLSRKQILNFRKKEFKKIVPTESFPWDKVIKLLMNSIIIWGFMAVSLIIQFTFYKKKNAELDKNLAEIRKVYPNITNKSFQEYLKNPKTLKTFLTTEKKKRSQIKTLNKKNAYNPILFLSQISEVIPSNFACDLITFDVGSDPTKSYLDKPKMIHYKLTFALKERSQANDLIDIFNKNFGSFQHSEPEMIELDNQEKRFKIDFSCTMEANDKYGDSV